VRLASQYSTSSCQLTVIVDDFFYVTHDFSVPPLRNTGLMLHRFSIGLKHGRGVGVQNKGDG